MAGEVVDGETPVKAVTFKSLHPILSIDPPRAGEAVAWYKDVFGFEEVAKIYGKRKAGQDEPLIDHAHLKLGDVEIKLADDTGHGATVEGGKRPPSALKGTTFTIQVECSDPDPVFAKAIAKGAKASLEVSEQDWGRRYGKFIDPFGFEWGLLKPVETKEDAKAEAENGEKPAEAEAPKEAAKE
ncbi:unnamed protein product [Closterium sp. NIES-64]|nr:unnamed protein product [Closterium sp. NIES-64]CAI6011007.1 unnamed protein product [Closterium sp. NIES-65]